MTVNAAPASAPHPEEDLLRAQIYGLLSTVLAAPPNQSLLDALASLGEDSTPLGEAFGALSRAAAATPQDTAEEEYQTLFIGITRGELVPFGSYYLTGFLNEKPLAVLRGDLAELGIAQRDEFSEPEDHIASLLEVMAGLILGGYGAQIDAETQKRFFVTHIHSWAGRFFSELENAQSAVLYRPVGRLGRLFLDIESQAFGMTE